MELILTIFEVALTSRLGDEPASAGIRLLCIFLTLYFITPLVVAGDYGVRKISRAFRR